MVATGALLAPRRCVGKVCFRFPPAGARASLFNLFDEQARLGELGLLQTRERVDEVAHASHARTTGISTIGPVHRVGDGPVTREWLAPRPAEDKGGCALRRAAYSSDAVCLQASSCCILLGLSSMC